MTRGTLELRRTVAGVAIRCASGTHAKRTFRRMNDLLTQLGEHGHVGYLRAVAKGDVTPLEMVDQLRGVDLATMATKPQTPLKRAVERFLATLPEGYHRRNMAYDLRRLTKDLPAKASSYDLVTALKAQRAKDLQAGRASGFNHLRAHVRRFVRVELGRASPAYQAIADMATVKGARDRKGHPCTVPEAFALAETLGAFYGPTWLAMCLTGMGPGEMWGTWEEVAGGVLIHGTKRAGRDRVVFRLAPIPAPVVATPGAFAQGLKRHGVAVRPYDARRTFARWCDLAGVPRIHLRGYLGHGPANLEDGYAMGNLAPYVARDGALFAAFVEGELGRPVAGLLGAGVSDA